MLLSITIKFVVKIYFIFPLSQLAEQSVYVRIQMGVLKLPTRRK